MTQKSQAAMRALLEGLPDAIVGALKTRRPAPAAAVWAHQRYSWEVVAGKYLDFFKHVVRA